MIISEEKYFTQYEKEIGNHIISLINAFNFSEKNTNLGYKTQTSAVYSSNIEGNTIDVNSFMNYKLSKEKFKSHKEIEEIENLILAYEYAQSNSLTEKNFLHCHKIFSKTLVQKTRQGKYRNEKVGVFGQSGLVYLAIEPELVSKTMSDFFANISRLQTEELSIEKIFYFASIIHLRFVHIHPFIDGNGRAARLLEKWFLSEKLGAKFWEIPSEKYYKENQKEYYDNLNLGVNFYELNYDKCLPFLLMLPNSLKVL